MGLLSKILKPVKKVFKVAKKAVLPVAAAVASRSGNPLISALGAVGGAALADARVSSAAAAADDRQAALVGDTNAAQIALQERINAENIAYQREEAARSEALQREFAQMGIRWRVEDAKAAGLHPLYAIGAAGASYTPSQVVPSSEAADLDVAQLGASAGVAGLEGQHLANAIARMETPGERQLRQANIKTLEASAQKDFAMASYYASEAMRNSQVTDVASPVPVRTYGAGEKSGSELMVYNVGDYFDRGRASPDQIVSKRSESPDISAANHSFWREYEVVPGRYVLLPFSEEGPSEALQDMPLWMMPLIYARNKAYYGPNWDKGLLQSLMPRTTPLTEAQMGQLIQP